MSLFSKIGEIIDDVKFEIKDTVCDLKYGDPEDKVKALAKVAKVGADITMITTGVGQVAKTAKTASKLAQCGKGAKMVTTFTANAQKSNMVKAGTKIAEAATIKAAANTVENMNNKTTSNTNNNYTGTSTYAGRWSAGFEADKETECKAKVRTKVKLGHWSRQEAIEYVKRELYSHYMAPLDDINATMFVDEALR